MTTASADRRLLLHASGVSKHFGGVRALSNVSLDVRAGEVHGLIGANGAGKSTLISVLSGAVTPDAGELLVDGRALSFGDVIAARKAGIAVVHQELMLFPDRTVEENVAAAALPTSRIGLIDQGERRRRVKRVLDALNISLNLSDRVVDLSLAQRQLVEIGRALCGGGNVFVLDEPTSALSGVEAAGLFAAIGSIAADGAGVVFVSHRLDEVFEVTQSITVLRDGRVEGNWATADVDVGTITHAMVGELADERPTHLAAVGGVVMSAREAMAPGVGPLDLDLRSGEVVGLAGLEGSGTSTLLEMLGGVAPSGGHYTLAGEEVRFRHPADAIARGVIYMPPDRKKGGLWLERSPLWNVSAAQVYRMSSLEWLRGGNLRRASGRRLDEVGVRAVDRHQPVERFSGGNQQRVMLARLIEAGPRILLLDDFTRGVDVKAKAAIHKLVRDVAREGMAVCLTASDLDELLEVADRLVCMRAGRIVAEGPIEEFDRLRMISLITTGAAAA